MKLRILTNAGCIIETPDVRCVIDPWLSDTTHYGSWAQWPRTPNLIDRVGPIDIIAISHCHMDHCCPWSLRELLRRNPNARVVIGDFGERNYLHKILMRERIPHSISHQVTFGDTELRIIPSKIFPDDIDSVIVIKRGKQSIVVWGDTPYSHGLAARVKDFCPDITLATLPYCGASNWPQCFYDIGSRELTENAALKRGRGLDRFADIRSVLSPTVAIPHAGQYLLAGRLWHLNPYRGNADATEVLSFDANSCVLADGCEAFFDLDTMQPSATRTAPYDQAEMMREALKLSRRVFDYERGEPSALELTTIEQAVERARQRSEVEADYWYCFAVKAGWVAVNARKDGPPGFHVLQPDEAGEITPRSEIYMDPRALHWCVTGRAHWNNAAGGSHFFTRRFPDIYQREADSWLDFFHA